MKSFRPALARPVINFTVRNEGAVLRLQDGKALGPARDVPSHAFTNK
jgi:hypothetical protein